VSEFKDEEEKMAHLTERGRRMAAGVSEFILMSHFFGKANILKQKMIK